MSEIYLNYTIHLIKCAISGTSPEPLPDNMDLEQLLKFARFHKVENIIYLSLAKLNIDNREIMAKFEEFYNHAVVRDATQQYYLEMITNAFEEHKIKYCVMKGPVIKKIYPSSDMRQSVDLDIYVEDSDTGACCEIMNGLGFTTKLFDKSAAHDEYTIDKMIEVELHRQLISNKCPWDKKCQEISGRLIKSPGRNYEYEMSLEDYYLYMIGHMAKHMKYSGIGIKMFLDIWVYMTAYKDALNRPLLDGRLKDCGLLEFEKNCLRLCEYWFCGGAGDEKIAQMAIYVGQSGNFGTTSQLLAVEMGNNAGATGSARIGKAIYYLKMFFQPYKYMANRYPVLNKLPVLLPIMWIHRALKTLLFDKDKAEIIKTRYDNTDISDGQRMVEFKKNIGL